MDRNLEDRRRNIIPRWRDFKTTVAIGKLRSSEPIQEVINEALPPPSLDAQIADWQQHRSLSFATDLVGASLVVGEYDGIQDAVEFILAPDSRSTELQRRVARLVREGDAAVDTFSAQELETRTSDELIDDSEARVKGASRGSARHRNPIKLIELARQYAILGSLNKALKTMDIAVALAPGHGFVLRSAARLFVHALEFDKAHYVLNRVFSLRDDPWLLAAEIAVSSEMNRTSRHIRRGLSHLQDGNFNQFELSELASAIGTVELQSNSKSARKLFRKALSKPTENASIAQAEWASRELGSMPVEVEGFDAPRKYEALASSHFREGDFAQAVAEGKNWILDQPFAMNPVIFTGFISNIMQDFDLSQRLYSFGLKANPESDLMRNNLAFALASNDEPLLAQAELDRIDRASQTIENRIAVKATEGLIEFGKREFFLGSQLVSRSRRDRKSER